MKKYTKSTIKKVQRNYQKIKEEQRAAKLGFDEAVQAYLLLEKEIQASGYDQGERLIVVYDDLLSFFKINNTELYEQLSSLLETMKLHLSKLHNATYRYKSCKSKLNKNINCHDLSDFFSFKQKDRGQSDRKKSIDEINVLQSQLNDTISLAFQCIEVLRKTKEKIDIMPNEAMLFLKGKHHLNQTLYERQHKRITRKLLKWSSCNLSIVESYFSAMGFQEINQLKTHVESIRSCHKYILDTEKSYHKNMSDCFSSGENSSFATPNIFDSMAQLEQARHDIGRLENKVNQLQSYNNKIRNLLIRLPCIDRCFSSRSQKQDKSLNSFVSQSLPARFGLN